MSWLILIGGAVLTVLGVIKIFTNGIKVLIWMLLLLAGVAGLSQGLQQHPTVLDEVALPTEWSKVIRERLPLP